MSTTLSTGDDEIVAELFQLARTGRFLCAAELLEEAARRHPRVPRERLDQGLRDLGQRLWACDYQGWRTEYLRQRRRTPGTHHTTRRYPHGQP